MSTGDDIAAYLGPKIEGGKPPDVAILPQPGVLQSFADQGDLVPIEDFAGPLVDANYAPGAREVGTVDDKLYAFGSGPRRSRRFGTTRTSSMTRVCSLRPRGTR